MVRYHTSFIRSTNMNLRNSIIYILLLAFFTKLICATTKLLNSKSKDNNIVDSFPDEDAVDKMKPLSEKLETSTNNIIEIVNKHKETINDIYLKVLSIPNLIFVLAITNQSLRTEITNHLWIATVYLSTLYTFLTLILFTLLTLIITNHIYNKHKTKLQQHSTKLNEFLYKKHIPNEEIQKEMIATIQANPVTRTITFFRFMTNLSGIINICSFILFIIFISKLLIIDKL